MTVVMCTGAAIVIGAVIFIIVYVAEKAIPSIHWGALFTKTQKGFEPAEPNALAHVGVAHAIVGTLEAGGHRSGDRSSDRRGERRALERSRRLGDPSHSDRVTAMSGLPSIVAGLFIYSILIINHVIGYSGFAASLALFVMLLPSVTRTTEEVLRVVPSGLREASLALGAPEWRTVWSVVLPTARSGVITAVLLGVARIVGETAPLLFTAFGSQIMNIERLHPSPGGPAARGLHQRQAGKAGPDRPGLSGWVRADVDRARAFRRRQNRRTDPVQSQEEQGLVEEDGFSRPGPAVRPAPRQPPPPPQTEFPTALTAEPTVGSLLGSQPTDFVTPTQSR